MVCDRSTRQCSVRLLPDCRWNEVDFIGRSPLGAVAIEEKAGDRCAPPRLVQQWPVDSGYVEYRGTEVLRQNLVWILPMKEFMRRLASGVIFI